MTAVRLVFAPAVLFASLGCGPPDLTELAGCYDLEMGPWSPPIGSDSMYVAPPTRMLLDTATSPAREGFIAREAPGAAPSIHGRGWWSAAGPDSLAVAFFGHSGVVVFLARSGGAMPGRAVAMWDYKSEEETAPVVVTPVACDAPLPEWAAARHLYPDGLVTVGGDSIRLGDPLPPDWTVGEGGPERVGSPALRPPFSGAERVELYGSAERGIYQIRAYFPSSVDRAAVVSELLGALGEPTWIWEAGRSEGLPAWHDRFVRVSLSVTGGREEERLFVRITDG